ncbi:DUF7139 domain-containing protein [Natronomonas sp.]|uniref:DUF7139 domain-containing protein n=1 Tax=Natronomonas sp. TaxID=2184060 RepID=UPI002FC3047B
MASLTEVYEGGNGASLRRLYAGVALFGVGAVLLVAGIVIAATELSQLLGLDLFEARNYAGVLGGLGLPALLLGTIIVLPRAERHVRVGAAAGGLICLVGVVLFNAAYPVDWVGGSGNTSMTLAVAAVYFTGAIVTSWSLFASVASFKARNDPGGTVKLEITKGGETKIVEVEGDDLRGTLGGIGLLGADPDGEVETQTNRDSAGGSQGSDSSGSAASSSGARSRSGTDSQSSGRSAEPGFGDDLSVTDGGATTDDAEFLDDGPVSTPSPDDRYCGNCGHFRYVRTDEGMVPYCGLHGEAMDDMEACDEWSPNTQS